MAQKDTGSTTQSTQAGDSAEPARVMSDALKLHLEQLWSRAKREREPRAAKWDRNRLTGQGEGPGLTGEHARKGQDGAWRSGDYGKAGQERLRVARQKLTTAKAALGDSVYKNNKVPFFLEWRQRAAAAGDDALAQLKSRIEEILESALAAMVMRDAIEDGGTWGEYWVHGLVRTVDGQQQAGVDVPSPYEMYVDLGSEDDVEAAEYVIRNRKVTPFEVWKLIGDNPGVFDFAAVRRAIVGARKGGVSEGQEHPAEQEGGRATTDTVEWREMWAYVPGRLLDPESDAGAAELDGGPETDAEWWPIMAFFAGGEPVAYVADPGPRPYGHFIWDRERTEPHPQGLYDSLESTQEVTTGLIRAWLANLRESSHITVAGHRDKLRQDPEKITKDGIRWIDLDPDVRDIREAIQQLTLQPMTAGLVEAIEMLMVFADLESNIPRVMQGQQPQADQTAYEIRERLLAAGKYLGEVVRRHDPAIIWLIGWVIYLMALAGEIEHEALVDVRPLGFATYSDLVQKIDGLIRLLGLGAQNEQVGRKLNTDWITRQVAQAEDIDVSRAFLSDEQVQARDQAQAQGEERQLALAEAQARTEGLRAKAARDAAAADDLRTRGQLGKARFIKDVEDGARESVVSSQSAAGEVKPKQQPQAAEGMQ